jgi:hypothetical protein
MTAIEKRLAANFFNYRFSTPAFAPPQRQNELPVFDAKVFSRF